MRITFVVGRADLSGGCKVIAIYAKKLAERGHTVSVVAPNPGPGWRDVVKGIIRGRSSASEETSHHLELVGAPYTLLEGKRRVTAEDAPDADVVIATWWKTAEWIRDFPASKGAKVYFLQHHEINMQGQPHDRVNATWHLPYHKITISRWLIDLAREFGDEDVTLVLNSVDAEQFHAPEREKAERPTVGFMYSTVRFKGCDLSLAALNRVARELPELRVIAFGVEEPSDSLPLPDCAEYTQLPDQNQIKDLYARCDVWLCGSRAEGFHLPPLEAMSCRCPVVSTRVGGPIDIIEAGVNGYLADVEDSEGLAENLLRILRTDPGEWKKLSDAALKPARDYSWDDATELFYAGLERALEKQS